MTENPYESPKEVVDPTKKPVGPTARNRSTVWTILVSSFVGAILGWLLLASFCSGPGDPSGTSISSAFGGLLGLIIGRLASLRGRPDE